MVPTHSEWGGVECPQTIFFRIFLRKYCSLIIKLPHGNHTGTTREPHGNHTGTARDCTGNHCFTRYSTETHVNAQHCRDHTGLLRQHGTIRTAWDCMGLHKTTRDCTVPHRTALLCSVQPVLFYQNCQGRTLCVYLNRIESYIFSVCI